MKKLFFYIITCIIFSCNSEDALNCFQTTGNTTIQEVEVSPFSKILVNRNVQLILKEANTYKVKIETGENLINDVEVRIQDSELVISDTNNCNYVRSYAATKVYVEAPNITEIRSSTQFAVQSSGVLSYNNLKLISENNLDSSLFNVGDFNLQLNSEKVIVTANGISNFNLSGAVTNLTIGFYGGTGRFEGAGLTAQNITIYHRGSNDMVVYAEKKLMGKILGVGNVIVVNTPLEVAVEELYKGKLIFEE